MTKMRVPVEFEHFLQLGKECRFIGHLYKTRDGVHLEAEYYENASVS